MPQQAASWSFTRSWRIAVVALAAALGAVAVCLVVLGTSQKQAQLGVLLGLWAALLAAYLKYGTHRAQADLAPVTELEEARAQASELQLARDAAARRESESNLELVLRRELERVMANELGSLRAEVAALRAEIVDKLGGQLRLERIETTRVIGSDLEALQNEIRRLTGAQPGPPAQAAPAVQPVPPVRRGDLRSADIIDAELVEFPPPPAIAELRPAESADASQSHVAGRTAESAAASQSSNAEQRAGRRRAPEPDPLRYQGRRRAGGDSADRRAGLDH